MRMAVCFSVCLSIRTHILSLEGHIHSSPNFLCSLAIAVVRSSSGGVEYDALCTSGLVVDDVMFAHDGQE